MAPTSTTPTAANAASDEDPARISTTTPAPAPAPAPAPTSTSTTTTWGTQLRGLIRIGLVFFVVDVFVRWLMGSRGGGDMVGVPVATPRKIITPSAADRINRDRTDEQRSSLEMVLGLQDYMPGGASSYVPQVFPTHDEEGISLGAMHQCVMPPHAVFDLLVYLTPFKSFELRRDRRHLVWTVPGVAFNWTYKVPPMPLAQCPWPSSLISHISRRPHPSHPPHLCTHPSSLPPYTPHHTTGHAQPGPQRDRHRLAPPQRLSLRPHVLRASRGPHRQE